MVAGRRRRPAWRPGCWDGATLFVDGGEYSASCSTIDELGDYAMTSELTQLWLLADAPGKLGWPTPLPTRDVPALEVGGDWEGPDRLEPWMELRHGRYRLSVCVAAWDPGNPFRALDTPNHALSALRRFTELAGVPWLRSGGVTSDLLIARTHDTPRGLPLAQTVAPEGVPVGELDPLHARPLAVGERGWAHCFDLNGAYLAAASSLALPAGEPEHVTAAGDVDLRKPGYWRIWAPPARPLLFDPFLPQPAAEADADGCRWVTSPTAALALELGELVVEEGWAWPEHHRFLDGWYRALRDARSAMLALEPRGPRGDAVLDAVKATYRQGVGRMGSSRRRQGDADPLYQPYWRAAIIAQARSNLWRRANKLRNPPFAVYVDALWVTAPTTDAASAAALVGIPLGAGLGQFKPVGHPVPAAAADAVISEARSSARAVLELRKLALA